MVHTAVGYARQKDRLQTCACTASVGPGSTNMLTGAALATINRIPVLLLPSDIFATRVSRPVLQELEQPYAGDVTVNDAFRPVSRYFDRVNRPEQLPSALLGAMRVLTDPAETGAVTLALPQDVQAEAFDWPVELFAPRVWRVAAPGPSRRASPRPREVIRSAQRPMVVAGGGVHYSEAEDALRRSARRPASRSARRRPARARSPTGTRSSWVRSARPGRRRPTRSPREADVVIGVGTRWSDFTTASRTVFQDNGRSVRQHQRRPVRRRQARRARGRRRRACHAHRTDRGPRRLRGRRRLPRAPGRRSGAPGTSRSRPHTTRPSRSPTRSPTGC